MKNLLILFILLSSVVTLEAKYKSAEELSRDIPIISTPKLTQQSGISFKMGRTLNTTYTTDYQFGLNYHYMASSFLGFVADGYYMLSTKSDLKKQLEDLDENATTKITLPNYSTNQASFNIGIIFKPVYGKITFFSEKIVHFNLYFLVMGGGAMVNLYKKPTDSKELVSSTSFAGSTSIAIGQNYYLTNSLAVGFEVIDEFTFGEQAKDDATINQTMSLKISVNYLF